MTDAPQVDGDARLLASRSAVVGLGTLLSRLSGVARILIIASVLGYGALSDTYNAANNAPNILYELMLGGLVTATLVPLFVEAGEQRDDRAVSAIFTVALSALVVLTLAATFAAPWIASVLTREYDASARVDARSLATLLVRCFMVQIFFYGLTALASALLNARRRFAAAAFAPIANNVVVIIVVALIGVAHDRSLTLHGVRLDGSLALVLGLGTTAGVVLTAVVLLPSLARSGPRVRALFEWRHPAVVRMLKLSGWTVGYVMANQIAATFVIVLAGRDQAVTAYVYAYVLVQLPHGLLAVSIMTALGPELASATQRGDIDGFRNQFSLGLRYLVLVIAPAAAGYIAIAGPVVALLFHHGQYTATGVTETAAALIGFAIGLLPLSLYLYTLRAFYARSDTRTPFLINCVENLLNIILVILLYPALGVFGLALGFSLAYVAAGALALLVLHRRLNGIDLRGVATLSIRVIPAAAACAGVAWIVTRGFSAQSNLVVVVVALLGGAAAYLGVLLITRPPEVASLLRTLRR